MIYIGIDPGVSGGIAFIDEAGNVLHSVKMPRTEADLLGVLRIGFVEGRLDGLLPRPSKAMIERVHSFPGQGHSGAFTFGRNYGALLMALTAVCIPFDLVSPRTWQQALGCLSGGDKNVTKRRAQQLFPLVPATHAIADALLLAEYCRRLHRGMLHARAPEGGPNGKAKGRRQTREDKRREQSATYSREEYGR